MIKEIGNDKRGEQMNYFHVCECGKGYEGFIKQTHCWICIIKFLKIPSTK